MPPTREKQRKDRPNQARRTHNLGGCGTCRKRHVKCDRSRPRCSTCEKAGLECAGFPPAIRWASADSDQPWKHKLQEDRLTSLQLSSDPGNEAIPVDPTYTLADASTVQECSPTNSTRPDTTYLHNEAGANRETRSHTGVGVTAVNQETASLELPAAPFAVQDSWDFDAMCDTGQFLEWDDLFNTGFDFMPTSTDFAPDYPIPLLAGETDQRQSTVREGMSNKETHIHSGSPMLNDTPRLSNAELLAAAPELIRYFKTNVLPQFGPLPRMRKSPWDINVCTSAALTLADMTYLQIALIKHARQAILFGVLGCAAHHALKCCSIEVALSPAQLEEILSRAASLGKIHLQRSLQSETEGPQRAKYKEQLMAILTMTALATLQGNQTDARCYLIDAERLLRLRGLAKKAISRRARLLHHVYTWLRIIGESTFVLHDKGGSIATYENHAHVRGIDDLASEQAASGLRSSPTDVQLDNFLRVNAHDDEIEVDLESPQEPETALRDIHLENQQKNPRTLYTDIYGIPETWLTLVSQTARIANVLEMLDTRNDSTALRMQTAMKRKANRLEQSVCSFALDHTSRLDSTSSALSSACHSMLQAMNSALVIFFYRRVRDVHPWILQSHVKDVLDALERFESFIAHVPAIGYGTPWPAFIAGCEAMSPAMRERFATWFDEASTKSTSLGVIAAVDVMREVWRRRETKKATSTTRTNSGHHMNPSDSELPDLGCTWIDILKERKAWLMLY